MRIPIYGEFGSGGVLRRAEENTIVERLYGKTTPLELSSKEISMSAESKVTTDHQRIRQWVEERGGSPARVKDTDKGNSSGILRIDYPGYAGEDTLEAITWEEFFTGFEKSKLAFLFQEETKDGAESRFSKLIDRESAENQKSRAASS
jgi:hypothetical protein